jgi:hypothetical protein
MKNKLIKFLLPLLIGSMIPLSAWATLGENSASIMSDQIALKATPTQDLQSSDLEKASLNAYQIQSLTTATDIVVKQYTYNGKVFAIIWNGKKVPDQNQLLGKYFPAFQTSSPSYKSLTVRKVQNSDFISSTGGWMGHYAGEAFIPSLAPAGVTLDSLK